MRSLRSAVRTSNGLLQARLLAAMLLAVGTLHFLVPKQFDRTIPDEIPIDKRALTIGSGIAEVGLAIGLLMRRTRSAAGLGCVGLFVAVFPANLNMVRMYKRHRMMRNVMLARLPLQIPMIVAAWQVWRRAAKSPRLLR